MGEVIHWIGDLPEWDLDELEREQLRSCLEEVQKRLAQLEELEPEDPESELYEVWGDRHEALEDLADEIMDRLDP